MSEENSTGAGKNNAFGIPVTSEENMSKEYTASTGNTGIKNRTPEEYFRWAVFGITMLLLCMATIQLYFSMEDTIRIWFEWQYVSLFKSIYNIVVIVLCIYIIKLFVFRKQA
ncbi:hypothetical protein V7O62_08515 [Methanolobus sp. ZRKC2]|uniref:hypothetical protein n=1 Tax=Methanolobus sp. ZRKC2 TaxID=3125783 RepID=UPI003252629D